MARHQVLIDCYLPNSNERTLCYYKNTLAVEFNQRASPYIEQTGP